MSDERLNLPNAITGARILACPVIFFLALSPGTTQLIVAFGLFVLAAVSDLWDGYLARRRGLVTDLGKLLDPVADKLLLVSTFIPFYIVSRPPGPETEIPWWGAMPLWVIIVIFGRELAVTLLRSWAARRGSVISAGKSGKIKAFIQNIFIGALLLWYGLVRMARDAGWEGHTVWELWSGFHGLVVGLSLLLAIVLTVYSMGVYLVHNRALISGKDMENP